VTGQGDPFCARRRHTAVIYGNYVNIDTLIREGHMGERTSVVWGEGFNTSMDVEKAHETESRESSNVQVTQNRHI